MDFIALDVETANAGLASICQVDIVTFRNGQVAEQWQTLVNPSTHTSICGPITYTQFASQPRLGYHTPSKLYAPTPEQHKSLFKNHPVGPAG